MLFVFRSQTFDASQNSVCILLQLRFELNLRILLLFGLFQVSVLLIGRILAGLGRGVTALIRMDHSISQGLTRTFVDQSRLVTLTFRLADTL